MVEQTQKLPGIGIPVLAYVGTLLGGIALWKNMDVQGLAGIAVFVPCAIALAWMIQRSFARKKLSGRTSSAQQAYMKRFIPLMIAYAVTLMAVTWPVKHYSPESGPIAFILAALPALPLVGVIWSMGKMVIDETDEYQRMLHVRQMMVATGVMLAIASVWGFLEEFGQVPHIPMYWAFIIWCAGLGVGSCVNEFRS